MSFDPYGPTPDPRRDDPTAPVDYPAPTPPADPNAMAGRVQLPAIFLIVVGVLNLLMAVPAGLLWNFLSNPTAEFKDQFEKQFADAMKKQDPKAVAEMERAGYTAMGILKLYAAGAGISGILWVVVALLGIVGGVRMMQMRSYTLSVLAALATAVPCVSGPACCGIGEAVGIWAIVVLLNADVRAAFR